MAYLWNPNALPQFDNETLILRIPASGLFARVSGPIVELLSQLPFSDVDAAAATWQERCGRADLEAQSASIIWHELMDLGAIREVQFDKPLNPAPEGQWIQLDASQRHSRLHRFMGAQGFLADGDVLRIASSSVRSSHRRASRCGEGGHQGSREQRDKHEAQRALSAVGLGHHQHHSFYGASVHP